jgi:manganese/zinc/iron transport system permease protein
MVFLAAIFGAFSGVIGTAISASENNLSTGPVIVLVASVFVVFSFVFSPSRGLLFKQIRIIKNRRDLELHKTLAFMYHIAETHEDISHPHAIKLLNNFQGYTRSTLQKLVDHGYVQLHANMWNLTKSGFEMASNLYTKQASEDE